MGGASRLIMLLTTPLPTLFLRHSLPRRLFTTTFPRLRSRPFHFSIKPSSTSSFHTQSTNTFTVSSFSSHPWPEWSHLINTILTPSTSTTNQARNEYSDAEDYTFAPEDAFVAYEEKQLSNDFVKVASALLTFAHDNPNLLCELSRRNIEVVVLNGTPFLFKTALETARRMRAFLGVDGAQVAESDKASTVDLMKYLLSYASNPSIPSERSGIYSRELTESSVRNLLREVIELSCKSPPTNQADGVQNPFPGSYGQTPRTFNQNIEMKRGDWICLKCNFMNFAKNNECLECEGPRPKRQLTGGEWDCPQCNFLNYGRNTVCLRCDCKRPVPTSINPVNSISESPYKSNIDNRLVEKEEIQRWFTKISQIDTASDSSNEAADEDFPEIMPLRKGENKFVVSTRKTPLERRLAKAPEGNISQNDGAGTNLDLDKSVKRSLDNILGRSSSSHDSVTKYSNLEDNSRDVPFVPLPADMFANKKQDIEEKEKEEEKPERWFKKMEELHDVKDLPSAVSDEDFPDIMPMRKGENRFVVSKKKDRSLTSPTYKRQVAIEQANSTKYVPFVPFPPGYFAKKEPQPSDQAPMGPTPTEMSSPGSNNATHDRGTLSNRNSNQSSFPQVTSNYVNSNFGEVNTSQTNNYTQIKPESRDFSGGSTNENSGPQNIRSNGENDSLGLPANENLRSGWSGKSLEGSAVKETDPLDMSEEAKAERWFRRVAQIKDISELSQIPDEDFPSIMPMRKGVNRFVVSKRKTPMERRLTSPQYRKNLPVVSSDPFKRGGDNDHNETK